MFLIYETSKKVLFNSTEIEVDIEVHAERETDAPDFEYGNEEENKKEMERFETGELENVCLRVQATFKGVVGQEYLGQCFLKADDFRRDAEKTVDYYEMIDAAVLNLTKQLEVICLALTKK